MNWCMRTFRSFLMFAGILLYSQVLIAQPADTTYSKFYYENGKLSSEGPMRQGKPDGYWKTYHLNGKLKSEGNRKNFQLDSTWKFYNEQGKLSLEYNYKEGKKNGPVKTYGTDGKLLTEEMFTSNIKHGPSYEYYPNGKVQKVIPFKEGREEGIGYEYDSTGVITSIITYKAGFTQSTERINRRDANGLRQGMWKDFWPNGKVKNEGRYLNDKKHGYFKEYNEFGNLTNASKWENGVLVVNPPELAKIETVTTYYPDGTIKEVGNYKDGYPEGVFRQYDSTGRISGSEVYKDGVLTGKGIFDEKGREQGHWKEYHETGELKAEGDYLNGTRVGDWTFYYADGKTDQKGKYDQRGRPVGTWKWYYENGQLLREEQYTDGVRNGTLVEYDENGTIITQGEYIDGQKEGFWFFQIADYREEGNYVAGERQGEWKHTYTTTGKQRFVGSFINGQPDGEHIYWYDNGKVWQKGKYVYGRKEGEWRYYQQEDGVLLLTITYKDGVETKFDGVKIKLEDPDPQ
jgi:uncharacterized protein